MKSVGEKHAANRFRAKNHRDFENVRSRNQSFSFRGNRPGKDEEAHKVYSSFHTLNKKSLRIGGAITIQVFFVPNRTSRKRTSGR